MKRLLVTSICLSMAAWIVLPASSQIVVKNQGYVPFGDAPINYRSENLSDPIAKLQKKLDSGEAKLDYEPQHGYLRSVLRALRVPISSQTLVFSKTSFQYPQISPDKPRALYYKRRRLRGPGPRGKSLEFVSFDPMQGAIFYVLDEHQVERPRFCNRSELDCIQCHVATTTKGVPGVMLRSVYTSPSGTQAGGTPAFITGHESPLKDRWGGWFVTGKQGNQNHMGNAILPDATPADQLDRTGASLPDLSGLPGHHRVSDQVQRHRRASGAGASNANAQSDHADQLPDQTGLVQVRMKPGEAKASLRRARFPMLPGNSSKKPAEQLGPLPPFTPTI